MAGDLVLEVGVVIASEIRARVCRRWGTAAAVAAAATTYGS